MKALKTVSQHWPVVLVKQSASDVHDATRVDSEKVAVIRQVVDRAECDAVDDGRGASWVAVVDDVCCLKQRRLAELADSTPCRVRAQDSGTEMMLVQPN